MDKYVSFLRENGEVDIYDFYTKLGLILVMFIYKGHNLSELLLFPCYLYEHQPLAQLYKDSYLYYIFVIRSVSFLISEFLIFERIVFGFVLRLTPYYRTINNFRTNVLRLPTYNYNNNIDKQLLNIFTTLSINFINYTPLVYFKFYYEFVNLFNNVIYIFSFFCIFIRLLLYFTPFTRLYNFTTPFIK
jgi:hypothetical protein